jgi:hypothetical protein
VPLGWGRLTVGDFAGAHAPTHIRRHKLFGNVSPETETLPIIQCRFAAYG